MAPYDYGLFCSVKHRDRRFEFFNEVQKACHEACHHVIKKHVQGATKVLPANQESGGTMSKRQGL